VGRFQVRGCALEEDDGTLFFVCVCVSCSGGKQFASSLASCHDMLPQTQSNGANGTNCVDGHLEN
jgi:hypothetical protein